MTIVVFRHESALLPTVCTVKFRTPAAAKKHIEEDAAFFRSKHKGSIDLGWTQPKTLDYYMVQLKNGVRCIWSYFTI